MWFYLLFISLTCEKAREINLQADIFISILVLCQRFIQTTAPWDGPPWKLIPAPRQADAVEGYAKDCLHCLARFPIPSHTDSSYRRRWGFSNESRRQQQRSKSKNVLPRLLPPHQSQKLHEPSERMTDILVNGNFHLWHQTCLLSLKSFSKICLKWKEASSPKFRTTSVCLKERKVFSDYNTD